jgi:hypothetical protein
MIKTLMKVIREVITWGVTLMMTHNYSFVDLKVDL